MVKASVIKPREKVAMHPAQCCDADPELAANLA
jgi:hypothetical protein